MNKFNFAEAYRSAGLMVDAETLKARQAPFDSVVASTKKSQQAINVARLYFGLSVQDVEWFREPFADADSTFSMAGNANEVAALAACVLEALSNEVGNIAALALATFRAPVLRPELLVLLSLSNAGEAINWRRDVSLAPDKIRPPSRDEATAAIEALANNQSLPQATEALRKISTDSQQAARQLAEQTKAFAATLSRQLDGLQEQVNILWWHVGAWSRVANKPFQSLNLGAAAILAGIDMADLSRTWVGPVAAPALLHRTVWNGRLPAAEPLTLATAVSSLALEDLRLVAVSDSVRAYPDVCPVLAALSKAKELDGNDSWRATFRSATGVDADTQLSPSKLAEQVFREASILAAIDQDRT